MAIRGIPWRFSLQNATLSDTMFQQAESRFLRYNEHANDRCDRDVYDKHDEISFQHYLLILKFFFKESLFSNDDAQV